MPQATNDRKRQSLTRTYTPLNPKGTSHSVSDGFTTGTVEEVKPWIARDVGRYQPSSVKAVIGMLLSLCRQEGSHGDKDENIDLFNACRKTIVSEWAKIQTKKKTPITTALKN